MKPILPAIPFLLGMLLPTLAHAGPAALPPAGQKLQSDYVQLIAAVEAPIRERYIADLQAVYDQTVSAGKLDEALALRTELNQMKVQPMLGRWKDTIGKGVMDLRPDGSVGNTNGAAGRWELRGEVLCILWDNGWRIECPIAKPGKKLHGKLIEPSGKTRPLKEPRAH